MAASLAALEVVFLRGLLSDLKLLVPGPVTLGIDNQGAVALAHDYVSNSKTKHIERRHLKIRELVLDAILRVQYVASKDNIADIFTKPLDKKTFIPLRTKLLNLPRKEVHWA